MTTNIVSMVIGILVIAVLFGAFIHTIADNTVGLNASEGGPTNLSTPTGAVLDLIPLIITIAVLIGVLSLIGIKVVGKL